MTSTAGMPRTSRPSSALRAPSPALAPNRPTLRRGCGHEAHAGPSQAREWSLAHFGTVDKARLFQFAEKRSAEDIQEMAKVRTWRVQIRNAQYQNLVRATAATGSRPDISRGVGGRRTRSATSSSSSSSATTFNSRRSSSGRWRRRGRAARGQRARRVRCSDVALPGPRRFLPPALTPSATPWRHAQRESWVVVRGRCGQGDPALHVGGDRDAGQVLPHQRHAQRGRGHRRCGAAPRVRGRQGLAHAVLSRTLSAQWSLPAASTPRGRAPTLTCMRRSCGSRSGTGTSLPPTTLWRRTRSAWCPSPAAPWARKWPLWGSLRTRTSPRRRHGAFSCCWLLLWHVVVDCSCCRGAWWR